MSFKLRFVQKISQKDMDMFLEIEKKFVEFERKTPSVPCGKRYLPLSGKEPLNSLIWECEFKSMGELLEGMNAIFDNSEHEELLLQQKQYMEDNYVEIYEELCDAPDY